LGIKVILRSLWARNANLKSDLEEQRNALCSCFLYNFCHITYFTLFHSKYQHKGKKCVRLAQLAWKPQNECKRSICIEIEGAQEAIADAGRKRDRCSALLSLSYSLSSQGCTLAPCSTPREYNPPPRDNDDKKNFSLMAFCSRLPLSPDIRQFAAKSA